MHLDSTLLSQMQFSRHLRLQSCFAVVLARHDSSVWSIERSLESRVRRPGRASIALIGTRIDK